MADDLSGQDVPTEDMPQELNQPAASGQDVPTEDMPAGLAQPSELSGQDVPNEDLPPEIKYDTPAQEALTFIEGMGRPLGGDVAIKYGRQLAEKYTSNPDAWIPKPEDVQGRREINPGVAGAGELVGNIAAMKGVGNVLPEIKALGTIGSKAFKGTIEAMAVQGGRELSDYLTGKQDPNPDDAVPSIITRIGAAGLFGFAGGTLFGATGVGQAKGLQALENANLGSRAQGFLTGYGAASRGQSLEDLMQVLDMADEGKPYLDRNLVKHGYNLYTSGAEDAAKQTISKGTTGIAAGVGYKIAGPWGVGPTIGAAKKTIEPTIQRIVGKPMSWAANKYIRPVITRILTTGETKGIGTALDYATKWNKGAQAVNSAISSLFRAGGQQAIDYEINPIQRKKIEKYIDEGGLNKEYENTLQEQPQSQEGYADGGEIKPKEENHLAKLYPEQSILMNAAKSRVYNYLNSLKPRPSVNKLPFDVEPSNVDQQKSYDKALDIATNPLSIVKHIKSGNLSADHVKHFAQMWPELHDHLSKQITNRIVAGQLNDEKPSYKIRQGLSMFLAKPLEATFTPMSIQAAQMSFMPKTPQQPAAGAPKMKRGTAKLGDKTNNMYKTSSQAAEQDTNARE
jgi:hypothetical protein